MTRIDRDDDTTGVANSSGGGGAAMGGGAGRDDLMSAFRHDHDSSSHPNKHAKCVQVSRDGERGWRRLVLFDLDSSAAIAPSDAQHEFSQATQESNVQFRH